MNMTGHQQISGVPGFAYPQLSGADRLLQRDSAAADVQPDSRQMHQEEAILFPLPVLRLLVLSGCTFGIYLIYWFYRQWTSIREVEHRKLHPVVRSIFPAFFVYGLLRSISRQAASKSLSIRWSPALLASLFILPTVFSTCSGWLSLLTYLNLLPVVIAQRTINRIVTAQGKAIKGGYSKKEIGLIVFGGTVTFLALVGTFHQYRTQNSRKPHPTPYLTSTPDEAASVSAPFRVLSLKCYRTPLPNYYTVVQGEVTNPSGALIDGVEIRAAFKDRDGTYDNGLIRDGGFSNYPMPGQAGHLYQRTGSYSSARRF